MRTMRWRIGAKKFVTTPEKLKAAVKKVGVMADDVETELKGQ